MVLFGIVVLQVWNIADGEAQAPVSRHGDEWRDLANLPPLIAISYLAGVVFAVATIVAIAVPRGGRLVCGVLMMASAGGYVGAVLAMEATHGSLGWLFHEWVAVTSLAALGVLGVGGGVGVPPGLARPASSCRGPD